MMRRKKNSISSMRKVRKSMTRKISKTTSALTRKRKKRIRKILNMTKRKSMKTIVFSRSKRIRKLCSLGKRSRSSSSCALLICSSTSIIQRSNRSTSHYTSKSFKNSIGKWSISTQVVEDLLPNFYKICLSGQ